MELFTSLEDKLRTLVALPTVTGDAAVMHQALLLVGSFLQQRGMQLATHTYGGFDCLVATTRPTKTPRVYLYAHLDVVPAPPELFILRKTAGKYIGRGVYDMKGALAAYLQAVEMLGDRLPNYDFGIIVTSDEEFGSKSKTSSESCFQHLLADGYLGDVYIMPDGGRDWQLEKSAKGFMHVILTAHGTAAHGSRPWEGENALHNLMDGLGDLRQHFIDQGPTADTMNIGVVQGGEVVNRIPHQATAEIDFRPSTPAARERILTQLERICKARGLSYSLAVDFAMIEHDLSHPLLVSFAESIQRVVGVKSEGGVTSFGGSDAQFLGAYARPAAVFYPYGGGHHSDTEWLKLGELERLRDVVLDYLSKVAVPERR